MVQWKKKYLKLKNSRKKSLLGRITGGINRVARSAVPLVMNGASALAAALPFIKQAGGIAQNVAAGDWKSASDRMGFALRDSVGYNPNTGEFVPMNAVKYGAGIAFPQIVKKGVKMVGRLI